MNKLVMSLAAAVALAATIPAIAQQSGGAPAVAIPKNTFYKGTGPSQYLARTKLIGQKVSDKSGQTIGEIDDVILSKDNKIEGVVLGVGGFLGVGEKKVGVRFDALQFGTKDGKPSITLAAASKDILNALEPYNGQKTFVQKASESVKDAAKKAEDAAKQAYDKAKGAVAPQTEEKKQ